MKKHFRWKSVFRFSARERIFRLGRFLWAKGDGPGLGKGHSAKFSLSLSPKIIGFRRERFGWLLNALFVRLHYKRAYGGWIV